MIAPGDCANRELMVASTYLIGASKRSKYTPASISLKMTKGRGGGGLASDE